MNSANLSSPPRGWDVCQLCSGELAAGRIGVEVRGGNVPGRIEGDEHRADRRAWTVELVAQVTIVVTVRVVNSPSRLDKFFVQLPDHVGPDSDERGHADGNARERGDRRRHRDEAFAQGPRLEHELARRSDDVTDTANGVDERGAEGIDLLAKVRDVNLDDGRATTEVVRPHPVENLRLGEDALGVTHEIPEEFELRRGEFDAIVSAEDFICFFVEDEVADSNFGVVLDDRGGKRTADDSADSCDEFLDRERLGDVVVSAGGQSSNAILDVVLRSEEQDGNVLVLCTDALHDFESVEVGKHDVENDDVWVEVVSGGDGSLAGCRGAHLELFVTESEGDEIGDGGFIVDDECSNRLAVGLHKFGGICGHVSSLMTFL